MPSEADLLIVGTGVVGSALLEMVERPLAGRFGLIGVASSRGVVLADDTPDLFRAGLAELRARPRLPQPVRMDDAVLDRLAAGRGILVDATADAEIGELYERALARGIHVVTANKKPIAGPWAVRERLFDPARRTGGAQLRYGATVGASLPILEALASLIRAGDRPTRMECVLSGTLGFLCNAIADGTPLSSVIAVARERGYTEPDAREDLRGADVARKAVILARELGAKLETSDVTLEPFLPRELLDAASPDTLERDVAKLDAEFAATAMKLSNRGERLVYLAQIETNAAGAVIASARPTAVSLEHPATQLEGTSMLAAFHTVRHGPEPIVLKGSGAGGAVTASAVLADVFAVQSLLGG